MSRPAEPPIEFRWLRREGAPPELQFRHALGVDPHRGLFLAAQPGPWQTVPVVGQGREPDRVG